jgi:hypothetical protein
VAGGVCAYAQNNHKRYTLDIDAVTDEKGLQKTKNILISAGFFVDF